MYAINPIKGTDLPFKTLCITFDDGPGEHTYAIGKYLFDEGIRATFFVVGKYAGQRPEVLQSLKDFKHLIANHTFSHPDMPYYRSINGGVQEQIIQTDLLIKQYITGDTTYFRSPYGKWSSELASDLNANLITTLDHIGPIHWDIGGMDCYYWQLNRSATDAAAEYYKEISEQKKGITLFHDDIADMDYVKPQNKTLELLKILIPKLKADGYQFACLDEITSIKKVSEENIYFFIKFNNNYLSHKISDVTYLTPTTQKDKAAKFFIQLLPDGKIAIQAPNNLFLSVDERLGNKISACKNEIKDTCLFDLISVNNQQICLRASNGNYLTADKKHGLTANARYMRQCQLFSCHLINGSTKTSLTFFKRLSLLKKRLLYIKSKIAQS